MKASDGRHPDLTATFLRRVILYDPNSGTFVWRARPELPRGRNTRFAGKPAGHCQKGCALVRIDGHGYVAHRLAWLYMTGAWPAGDIDHIDGDPHNNRYSNLRICTHAENMRNVPVHVDNALGEKGIRHRTENSFAVRITVDGKHLHIGSFPTLEKARIARDRAYLDHHGPFACVTR